MVATDAAFLAEVAVFLDQNDAPEAAEKMYHKEVTTPGDDGLLLASHQLLAETEKLLSSYDTPTDTQHELNVNSESTNTNPSEEDKTETLQNDNISTEKRREIRNAQAAQRRLRYRQKLRDEKETLRQQTTELSTQLTILETAQVELKTRQASNLMFGAWRAVAARQLERRLQAEQQQKLLRAEVVGRARLIHQMSLLLEDRLKSKQQDRLISYEWVETNCETGGSALFTTMLEELDDAYLRTDDFVYGLEFESAVQVAYNLTRNQKDGVLYFDSADRVVVPYNFEQAAVGLSIVMMSDPDVDYATVKVEDLKDTLTIKYHVKCQLNQGESVSFRIYGAAKRYREKDRLVLLWRSFTEGLGEFEGLHSNDTTWMVVRPLIGKSAGNRDQCCTSTVLESYTRLLPTGFDNSSGCDNVDRFVNTLARSGEEEFKQMMQTMEKLMINHP